MAISESVSDRARSLALHEGELAQRVLEQAHLLVGDREVVVGVDLFVADLLLDALLEVAEDLVEAEARPVRLADPAGVLEVLELGGQVEHLLLGDRRGSGRLRTAEVSSRSASTRSDELSSSSAGSKLSGAGAVSSGSISGKRLGQILGVLRLRDQLAARILAGRVVGRQLPEAVRRRRLDHGTATTTMVSTSGRPSRRLARPTTAATMADMTVRPRP